MASKDCFDGEDMPNTWNPAAHRLSPILVVSARPYRCDSLEGASMQQKLSPALLGVEAGTAVQLAIAPAYCVRANLLTNTLRRKQC